MDFNSIRDQISQISLYDVKANIRKVQNAVMNYTEMEAKVREATNNEPWGASSTAMQEIANGTFHYQLLNEIMPMIYKRFTEKSAEEWRQIYKALQLLEFLIKHGSERVIDDARSHLSLLKMLRQFHYIDQNGKDQGINVRNRSKELCELLGDVDRIRAERKKAKGTKSKYSGVEGGSGAGIGGGGSSSRYGGFGSESGGHGATFGGATRQVYGDGGGFGGEGHDEYDEGERRTTNNERFDEYNEYDDGGAQAPSTRRKPAAESSAKKAAKKPEAPKPKEPEVDLFDFGDDAPAAGLSSPPASMPFVSSATSSAPVMNNDDDDFDDFQSATPAAPVSANTVPAIPKPNYSSFSMQPTQPIPQTNNFGSLLGAKSPTQTSTSSFASQPAPTGYQPTGPNYFTSVQVPSSQSSNNNPTTSAASSIGAVAQPKKTSGGDAFASLLAGANMKKTNTAAPKSMTIADMAKQKSQAGLYGANAPVNASVPMSSNGTNTRNTGSNGLNDLLG